MSKKVSESLMSFIRSEVEATSYGRVIIELNETANKIDVITERRQRFNKEEENGFRKG